MISKLSNDSITDQPTETKLAKSEIIEAGVMAEGIKSAILEY